MRERLIVKFAVLAGMRPDEILGLRRGHIGKTHVAVSQRVYRGDIDTPKTVKSIRKVALPEGLRLDLQTWLTISPDTGPDGWLFPSEKVKTPLAKDNVWRRHIALKFAKARPWVGEFPCPATITFIADARAQRGSEDRGRSARTHARCKSERVYRK